MVQNIHNVLQLEYKEAHHKDVGLPLVHAYGPQYHLFKKKHSTKMVLMHVLHP